MGFGGVWGDWGFEGKQAEPLKLSVFPPNWNPLPDFRTHLGGLRGSARFSVPECQKPSPAPIELRPTPAPSPAGAAGVAGAGPKPERSQKMRALRRELCEYQPAVTGGFLSH